MGDWNLLGSILEEVHIHSTIVGKIWLTILFIFRMLVLGVAAEDVWDDEQAEFICNTEQPGCSNICYDKAFPISLIRYWVLQVIFVSSPSLAYMGHALYRLRSLEKERQRKKAHLRAQLEETEPILEEHRKIERELRKLEEQKKVSKAPLQGALLWTYILHILTRSGLEVGFMIGQYLLYGFQMHPLYKCTQPPCPNTVDCFVSRPTEKTIFMVFMHSIAAVSLFLNILEIIHLGIKKIKNTLCGKPKKQLIATDEDANLASSKKTSVIQQVCIMSNSSPQGSYKLMPEQQVGLPVYLTPEADGYTPAEQTQNSASVDPPWSSNQRSRPNQHQGQLHHLYRHLEHPREHEPHPRQLPRHLPNLTAQRYDYQHQNTSSSSEEAQKSPQQSTNSYQKPDEGTQSKSPQHAPKASIISGHSGSPQATCNVLRKHSRVVGCRDLGDDRCDSPDSGHHPNNRKSSFLSRVLSESQLDTDSETSDSRNGSGSEAKRRDDSSSISPPPPSTMGRRMSMASRPKRPSLYTLLVTCY